MPRKPTVAAPKSDPAQAMQEALAELLVVMTPDIANRVALGCLHLAAAAVAMAEAGKQSPRIAVSELLLLLADTAPGAQHQTTTAA